MHEERSWILIGILVAPFVAMLVSVTLLWVGRRFVTDGREWIAVLCAGFMSAVVRLCAHLMPPMTSWYWGAQALTVLVYIVILVHRSKWTPRCVVWSIVVVLAAVSPRLLLDF